MPATHEPPALHRPAGSLRQGDDPVGLEPAAAGWRFVGLRVIELPPGGRREFATGTREMAVLPLAGSCVVECEGRRLVLRGRTSVFHRVSDFAYVPIDAEVRITASAGGVFALPFAEASRRLDVAYGPAEDVPIEIRGAGRATRQVTNFLEPAAFPADRLMAVEVLTPSGNWSSYPPHKHDEADPACGELPLEEIYYFRVRDPRTGLPGGNGFALHRTYDLRRGFDVTAAVGDGDVFLVPSGYHGPSVASPDHDLYYLNVLAGPSPERRMAFCDDPAHAWVRASWRELEPDPRVPMTSPEETP
ncbi:MAG TPA: 5-deoxy-glucuronate isomerase [Actinomycetota bacterium]|nr:5-deoxy-glucuronate isomerase [Actinomycetota bacterium]